jgi:NOL1/NOP2/fmu family ribosome biogenesis protein
LEGHRSFDLQAIPGIPGALPGRHIKGKRAEHPEMRQTVRLWPHHLEGEGHFIALLKKNGDQPGPEPRTAEQGSLPATLAALFSDFCQRYLPGLEFPPAQLGLHGSYLYLAPAIRPPGEIGRTALRYLHPGLWLGVFKANRFEPSHALALACLPGLHPDAPVLNLEPEDPLLAAYLHGDTLPVNHPEGWLRVAVSGYPLGWCRSTGERLKNFYPHGLRRPG